MPRKKAGKFHVQREKKRQKQLKLEGLPGGKKAKKRAKKQDLSTHSPASKELPSGDSKTSISQEHLLRSPQKPNTLPQNTTGRPVTNKIKLRVAKGVIKYLGKKDKPPRVRGKRSQKTLPVPPLSLPSPFDLKASTLPIMSQGGGDTRRKPVTATSDCVEKAIRAQYERNVGAKPLNPESSSDDEDDPRLANLRSVVIDSQSIIQTAADAATNKRKARRGKGSTERSKLARHRIGGGSSDEEPELKHYQIRTQDLLYRHLDRTFGKNIGSDDEATHGPEKKTEGEVDGGRGGQGRGAEGGVDKDVGGWGGIRLFGKSICAKRGRSEADGGDKGEEKKERKKKRKKTKDSKVEAKSVAQVDKLREEGSDVERESEKESDAEKPKKKKGKAKMKEEVETPDNEGRVKKRAKKIKKLKTGKKIEEGVVGNEDNSLALVSNKRGHIEENDFEVNGGLGVVEEGMVESDIDKVGKSKKKAKVKVKKKKNEE